MGLFSYLWKCPVCHKQYKNKGGHLRQGGGQCPYLNPNYKPPSYNFEPTKAPAAQPTQTSSQRVVVIKETVKEIVKIPCRYCGTLVLITDSNCAKCGAVLR